MRVPGRAVGVEVSQDDVVITEVKKMVTGLSKSGGAAGDRGDVNVVRDIVDGGCNGKVLSHRVEREEGVGGEMDEGDGVMIEDENSSTTRVTRTVLTLGRICLVGFWLTQNRILVYGCYSSVEGKIIGGHRASVG